METRDERCAALLGLLQPTDPDLLQDSPQRYPHGGTGPSLRRHRYLDRKCGRSKPIYLKNGLSRAVLPCDGVHACEVCREELQKASSKSQRFIAWINQHRLTLDSSSCLEFPADGGLFKEPCAERYSRITRFVYEQFWRKR